MLNISAAEREKCIKLIGEALDEITAELLGKIKVYDTPEQTASSLAGIAYQKQAIEDLKNKLTEKLSAQQLKEAPNPVSYTHLTLPTIYSV